ncbi:DUF1707 domain-containing protein [Spirillospora sp. NPDC049652]
MTDSARHGGPDSRNGLRIGDAERDAVALALHEHYAAGRLEHGELDERLDAALAAKTLGDLRAVVRDLPEPNGLPAPAREPGTAHDEAGAHGRGRHGHHGLHPHRHGYGLHGPWRSHGHGPAPAWGPGHPAMWAGAGHPAWRGRHRRRAIFPVLAVLFAVVVFSSGAGTALLAVFHVVVILWIVRALALLVHTRRRRRALR